METVRDMHQFHAAGNESEIQTATMRELYSCSNSVGLGETVRSSQQQRETNRDMQKLCGTGRDSVRQPATIGHREYRYVLL